MKHPGYIVVSQKQIHLDKKRNGWMCVIQTPIEVSMNFNYVMKTVENEFNLSIHILRSYTPVIRS